MAKEFAKTFYKSKAWRRCRESYIKERESVDGGMCEECGEEPGYIVHHVVTLTPENINDAGVSLNHKYLKYDCKACHDREDAHAFVKTAEPLCDFDSHGQPIPPISGSQTLFRGTGKGTSEKYTGNFTGPPPYKKTKMKV